MTAREPSPSAQFSAFLSRFPPEIIALVKRCLPKIRRAVPASYELVYDYSNSLVVGFGVTDRGYEAIVAALRGYLPEDPFDPHDHQVGVEEEETEDISTRLARRGEAMSIRDDGFSVLLPDAQHWRDSNIMKVPNANLLHDLGGSDRVGGRLWRHLLEN